MATEVNPLDHPDMKTNRNRTVLLISILLLSMIFGSMAPTAAAADITGPALEWKLVDPLPDKVESDDQVTVKLMFRNIGDLNLTGNKRATIELQSGGHTLDSIRLNDMRLNMTQQVVFRVRMEDDGFHVFKLNAYNQGGVVGLYGDDGAPSDTIGSVEVETIVEPFNWIPIIAIAVVAAVILGVLYFMNEKKKKEEEAQRLVAEARRQEMIRKKEAVIAKKIEVRQVVGKNPRDYYILRRTKYANLKPSGLTRGGLTILSRVKSKAELEEARIVCPKCGTDLPEENAVCPRCSATEKIEHVRHDIRSYKSRAEADFTDAEALLRKAEHRLNWSDFAMAYDLVDKAEQRMNEIWEAAEKGETLESTVMEYSGAAGPSLKSKIIGLEGEETAIPAAIGAGLTAAAAKDIKELEELEELEEVEGEQCTECGHPMVDDECLICGFDENLNATWSTIEMAELDGADMGEIKGLCRQANNAKERGSDELAFRYLRRAMRMSDEIYHSHARTKTEGIIEFTNTLIMQVKTMGEDVTMAEQMIVKAKEAMEANDYEGARSMAAKADGYLKQMREDSFRKVITELMPVVEAGASSNPDVETLLVKVKKLIDAGEFEGAVDLLEAAKDKL